jgi:hypothetical protein
MKDRQHNGQKKDRQHNGQNKDEDKRINNDLRKHYTQNERSRG